MTRKASASFDALMKSHYGKPDRADSGIAARVNELLASRYGRVKVVANGRGRRNGHAPVVSLSCDDRETLGQRQGVHSDTSDDEYIVPLSGRALASALSGVECSGAAAEDVMRFEEYRVDVFNPHAAPEATPLPAAPVSAAAPAPARPMPAAPSAAPVPSPLHEAPAPAASAPDADFMADMQSILSGGKAFDPEKKQTVPRDELGRRQPADPSGDLFSVPAPDAKNSQAIFDRIAQSMEYANKYDLGTVELKNRFSDFDRIADTRQRGADKKQAPVRPAVTAVATPPQVPGAEFIEDLDAIRAPRPALPRSDGSAYPVASDNVSRPFYATGEHVLAGDDLYVDRLRVGAPPGVPFSYGQLIAMADLYASVEQMAGADVVELTTLKALIEQSTAYHRDNRGDSSLDVSSEAWDTATGKRFRQLAQRNYRHFSPNPLVAQAAFSNVASKHGTNKSAWEEHHRKAIDEARRMFVAQPPQASAVLAEWPLVINAFGDHFLTDAFSAGHLINKEATIEFFRVGFLAGNTLTPQGTEFFRKVALLAFTGDVAQKFSALETVDYPVYAAGWCFKWHPNINTWERFSEVLIAAAQQEPEAVGNLCVLSLYDKLNRAADIEVFNTAGDAPWKLTGDGTLNTANLAIMRRAVKQSAENITDPSIFVSAVDYAAYFSKVWKHVPQLTEASQRRIATMTTVYTRPDSDVLIAAAASIVQRTVTQLIAALLTNGKLKRA